MWSSDLYFCVVEYGELGMETSTFILFLGGGSGLFSFLVLSSFLFTYNHSYHFDGDIT